MEFTIEVTRRVGKTFGADLIVRLAGPSSFHPDSASPHTQFLKPFDGKVSLRN